MNYHTSNMHLYNNLNHILTDLILCSLPKYCINVPKINRSHEHKNQYGINLFMQFVQG